MFSDVHFIFLSLFNNPSRLLIPVGFSKSLEAKAIDSPSIAGGFILLKRTNKSRVSFYDTLLSFRFLHDPQLNGFVANVSLVFLTVIL